MDVFTYERIFIRVCIYLCTCTERSLAFGSERLIAMLSVAAETPSVEANGPKDGSQGAKSPGAATIWCRLVSTQPCCMAAIVVVVEVLALSFFLLRFPFVVDTDLNSLLEVNGRAGRSFLAMFFVTSS